MRTDTTSESDLASDLKPGLPPGAMPDIRPNIKARLRGWQDALREPCLSALLAVQIIFIFLAVPLTSEGLLPRAVVDCFQFALALASVFVLPGLGLTRIVILLGFGLTLVTSSVPALDPTRLLHYLGLLLFTSAVSLGVAKAVFSDGEVTHHRVRGAVVVYLNLALVFTTVYAGLCHLSPGTFSNVSASPRPQFGQLLYFSPATLTTTGYGDIVPLLPDALPVPVCRPAREGCHTEMSSGTENDRERS